MLKKEFKFFYIFLFTILILLTKHITTQAAIINDLSVGKNKIWTITFNREINLDSATKGAISVSDSNGNTVNVTVELGNNKKTILVKPPSGGYDFGQVYTLKVNTDISSTNNAKLNALKTMTFYIGSEDGKEQGNSTGNIMNVGLVSQKGDWIYYCNHSFNGALYKIKNDGTQNTKLNNDTSIYINVYGEWVYYYNESDGGKLYRVKIDGTGRTKLNDDESHFLNIENGWIYYSNKSNEDKLYKIRIDGTSKTLLSNDATVYLNVFGDYIYYVNLSDGKIYRIKTDGTEKQKVSDDTALYLNVSEGWIYYVNDYDNYIYKMKIDGTDKTKIYNTRAASINVQGDWIYYTNLDYGNALHKLKTSGSTDLNLTTEESYVVNVLDDYITYEGSENTSILYKANKDGYAQSSFGVFLQSVDPITLTYIVGYNTFVPMRATAHMSNGFTQDVEIKFDVQEFDTSKVGTYTYEGRAIGYKYNNKVKLTVNVIGISSINDLSKTIPKGTQYTLPWEVPAIMTDGSTKTVHVFWNAIDNRADTSTPGEHIYEGTVSNYGKKVLFKLNVLDTANRINGKIISKVGDYTYFYNQSDNNKVYKISSDLKNEVRLSDEIMNRVVISDGWLYYAKGNDLNKLYKMTLDGTNETKISDDTVDYIKLDGGSIYYSSLYEVESLFKINTDGSGKFKVTSAQTGFQIVDDWIYYVDGYGPSKLCKIKTDGSQRTVLSYDRVSNLNVVDDWIYYIDNYGVPNIAKIRTDGTGKTDLNDNWSGYLNVIDDWIYYVDTTGGNYKIFKMKTDGTGNVKLADSAELVNIIDGWIYYRNIVENNILYKMRTDGTESQMVI
jgi:Bacterial Ig-like domain (group 4).